jgi:transcriptional regulator with XRE-family HTH domain
LEYFSKRQDQGYRFILLDDISLNSRALAQLNVRSAIETLSRIREVFKFSISDLAAACQVSRQAVYKWISGESSSLEHGNQSRLDDLYAAAELFAARGAVGSPTLLKRRNNAGRTLVETMRAGESAQAWARATLEMLALESQQRAVLDARLRTRRRSVPETEEWGIPIMSESDT